MTPVRVRVSDSWLPRLDALALALARSRPGIRTGQPDVIRVALAKGIEALEREFNLSPEASTDG